MEDGEGVSRMGWVGRADQVMHYLRTVGADRGEDGRFIIRGTGVATFMGSTDPGADVAVAGDVDYFVGGKPCNLAGGLRGTSYGLGVAIF